MKRTITCPSCNKTFDTESWNKKFCDPVCADRYHHRRARQTAKLSRYIEIPIEKLEKSGFELKLIDEPPLAPEAPQLTAADLLTKAKAKTK